MLADYALSLTTDAGGDRSGRWLDQRTSKGHSYWAECFRYTKPLTVNDVEELAILFDMTPYEFTMRARLPLGMRNGDPRADLGYDVVTLQQAIETGDPNDPGSNVIRIRKAVPTEADELGAVAKPGDKVIEIDEFDD